MIWVSWRQQRTETYIALGILVALAAFLIPTGLNMASAYHDAHLGSCLGTSPSDACHLEIDGFLQRFDGIASLIAWLTLVPGLIGVLLAAPFILPIEHGTYRLDWTQSITRETWVSRKLGMGIAGTLLASLALTLLLRWWQTPRIRLQGRMDNSVFDSQGIVIFGYTLFALALAVAVGVVWRRAVPGLMVGFAGYFVARIFTDTWLRQRLAPTHALSWKNGEPAALHNAWVLTQYPTNAHGDRVSMLCIKLGGSKSGFPIPVCPHNAPVYMHAVFHPASQFWQLQLTETAMFGGIAVLLLAFSAWWTLRRTA